MRKMEISKDRKRYMTSLLCPGVLGLSSPSYPALMWEIPKRSHHILVHHGKKNLFLMSIEAVFVSEGGYSR